MTGSSKDMIDMHRFREAKTDVGKAEFASLTFQLFYAIYVLTLHGINHNDMHAGNVLFERLETPIILEYNIGERSVKFSTKYIVKLYDWDRSTKRNMKNRKLDICDAPSIRYFEANLGDSNNFHPKRDLYQLLCEILYGKLKTWTDHISFLLGRPCTYQQFYSYSADTRIDLSRDTIMRLRDRFRPVDDNCRDQFYFLSMADLHSNLTAPEFLRLTSQYAKTKDVMGIYFNLNARGIRIPKGHGCQMLHNISDAFLPPVASFFQEEYLWRRLTTDLALSGLPAMQSCTA